MTKQNQVLEMFIFTRQVSLEPIYIYNDGLPKRQKASCRDGGLGLKNINKYNINIGQNTHPNKRDSTTLQKRDLRQQHSKAATDDNSMLATQHNNNMVATQHGGST